jgi:hypothetical protein
MVHRSIPDDISRDLFDVSADPGEWTIFLDNFLAILRDKNSAPPPPPSPDVA